jgi:hypothetical protein
MKFNTLQLIAFVKCLIILLKFKTLKLIFYAFTFQINSINRIASFWALVMQLGGRSATKTGYLGRSAAFGEGVVRSRKAQTGKFFFPNPG